MLKRFALVTSFVGCIALGSLAPVPAQALGIFLVPETHDVGAAKLVDNRRCWHRRWLSSWHCRHKLHFLKGR